MSILGSLKYFTRDKFMHFGVGMFITLLIGIPFNPLIGLIVSVIISICKELLWDKWWEKGTPELADLLFGAVGAFIGYIWFYTT